MYPAWDDVEMHGTAAAVAARVSEGTRVITTITRNKSHAMTELILPYWLIVNIFRGQLFDRILELRKKLRTKIFYPPQGLQLKAAHIRLLQWKTLTPEQSPLFTSRRISKCWDFGNIRATSRFTHDVKGDLGVPRTFGALDIGESISFTYGDVVVSEKAGRLVETNLAERACPKCVCCSIIIPNYNPRIPKRQRNIYKVRT
jgi:hypothetical protein